jgi:hypothetical protein
MVPRTSTRLARDICNTWMDDTRATNASEVRIPRVWHACVTCYRRNIPRTFHADVVHMMRVSCARHLSRKCDVKRAGSAQYMRCTRRFLAWVTFGQYCRCYRLEDRLTKRPQYRRFRQFVCHDGKIYFFRSVANVCVRGARTTRPIAKFVFS